MDLNQWVEIIRRFTEHLGPPAEGELEGPPQDRGHDDPDGEVCLGTQHCWRWARKPPTILLFISAASHEECSPTLLDVKIERHICWINISLLWIGRALLELHVNGLETVTWWGECTGATEQPRIEIDAAHLLPTWSTGPTQTKRRLTDPEALELLTAMIGWFAAYHTELSARTP